MNSVKIKDRQREERGGWPGTLRLRVHRALSWLHRTEQRNEDGVRYQGPTCGPVTLAFRDGTMLWD